MTRTSLLVAVSLLFCTSVLGQETKSQPVARLITRFNPTTTTATTLPANASPTLAEAGDIERRAFEQTNLMRVKNGLPALVWDAAVCRMARVHSDSMSDR